MPRTKIIRSNNTREMDTYHAMMKRFEHSRMFGRELVHENGGKGTPIHVNSRRHPMPLIAVSERTGNKYRKPAELNWAMRRNHLLGTQAVFHLSPPRRYTSLMALDFDDVGGADYDESILAVRGILKDIWPDLVPFFEPGRSYPDKKGFYVWLRVRLDGFAPDVRKQIESPIQRVLEDRLVDLPPGIKFDGLKGTISYEYSNPAFDHEYAFEYVEGLREFDVHGDTEAGRYPLSPMWLRWDQARKYLKEKRPDVCVHVLPYRYAPGPRVVAYETAKVFYGIGWDQEVDHEERFDPDPRLERIVRHYGTLVTAPCYKALSGERDNNIAAFRKWTDENRGLLLWRDVKAILPCDMAEVFTARRVGNKALGADAHEEATTAHHTTSTRQVCLDDIQMPASLPQPVDDANWRQLTDESEEQHVRYGAAARIALLYTEGDDNLALAVGLALVESSVGPATGERHSERVDHMDRCITFALQSFNLDAARAHPSTQKLLFDEKLTASMESFLRQRVSDVLLGTRQARKSAFSRFKWTTFTKLTLLLLHNIHTGNPGEVPVKSLAKGMKELKSSVPNSVIKMYMELLRQACVVIKVANHSADNGRCARYALHDAAELPGEVNNYLSRLVPLATMTEVSNDSVDVRGGQLEYMLPVDVRHDWSGILGRQFVETTGSDNDTSSNHAV